MPENLFDPGDVMPEEYRSILVQTPEVRIERIVSWGNTTAPNFWYDQEENEWITLLEGEGVIRGDDGEDVRLTRGKPFMIPAHWRHQVVKSSSPAIWLCVFFKHAGSDEEDDA